MRRAMPGLSAPAWVAGFADLAVDAGGCLLLHGVGHIEVNIQRRCRRNVSNDGGKRLYIHAVFQRHGVAKAWRNICGVICRSIPAMALLITTLFSQVVGVASMSSANLIDGVRDVLLFFGKLV